jgi:hypothetical protein
MAALDMIADRQAGWSVTANKLKAGMDRARWAVFGFSVLGALLAAIASQWTNPPGAAVSGVNDPRTWIAIVGALSLATATFFTQRLLGKERVSAWVRARAISEVLKREAYKYAADAAPYDQPATADALLASERKKIEDDGDDLLPDYVTNAGAGSVPRKKLPQDEYKTRRVDAQINFYRTRATSYQGMVKVLRRTEFCLALAATLITALASVTGKATHLFGYSFDIAALTAVLTTIAGAVLAHVEASRFDYLATVYLSTARRLEDRKTGPAPIWSDFVKDCESILETENTAWIAKWSKAPT